MKYSVISINEDIVILENESGALSEHSISEFSVLIKEGDIVKRDVSRGFFVDHEATANRKKIIHGKLKHLFEKNHN